MNWEMVNPEDKYFSLIPEYLMYKMYVLLYKKDTTYYVKIGGSGKIPIEKYSKNIVGDNKFVALFPNLLYTDDRDLVAMYKILMLHLLKCRGFTLIEKSFEILEIQWNYSTKKFIKMIMHFLDDTRIDIRRSLINFTNNRTRFERTHQTKYVTAISSDISKYNAMTDERKQERQITRTFSIIDNESIYIVDDKEAKLLRNVDDNDSWEINFVLIHSFMIAHDKNLQISDNHQLYRWFQNNVRLYNEKEMKEERRENFLFLYNLYLNLRPDWFRINYKNELKNILIFEEDEEEKEEKEEKEEEEEEKEKIEEEKEEEEKEYEPVCKKPRIEIEDDFFF